MQREKKKKFLRHQVGGADPPPPGQVSAESNYSLPLLANKICPCLTNLEKTGRRREVGARGT